MTPSVGVVASGAIDGLSALIAAALVIRAPRPAAPAARTAIRVCAAGFAVGAVTFAGTGAWIAVHGRSGATLAVASIGLSAQGIAVLAGAFRLDGSRPPFGLAVRRGIEGMVVTSCAAYAIWAFVAPRALAYLGTPLGTGGKIAGLFLLTPPAMLVCMAFASGLRSYRVAGSSAVLLPAALQAMFVGGAVLVVAAGYDAIVPVVAAVALFAAGCAVAGVAIGRGAALSEPLHRGSGTMLAWVPVSVAIVACVLHLAIYHWADNTGILIATVIGASLGARQALATRDIRAHADELVQREARYRELAHTDALTGLGNRRAFLRDLSEEVIGGPPSVVLAIDLDGFKNINDLRGHDVGDAVLVEVARRLRINLRPDDIPARLGGDEFAVVMWLPHAEAIAAASRLRAVLAAPYDIGSSSVFLSASIGIAPSDGVTDVAELIRHADLALRFAKLRGKNRVEGYAAAYAQWLRRRLGVEEQLLGAIARSELSVLYQPIVALPAGRVVGVEALLRWHHPTLGSVLPGEFTPIAEQSHLIDDLGRWALGETCRQLARWLADGLDLWLAVNVSAHQLHRPDYVDQVVDVLRTHHVPADRLVLEVAEHAVAVDLDELIEPITALRATGVRVALDDFGAGYSTFGRLRRMPADMLKVRRSVVAGGTGPDLSDVVTRLGEHLGLDVVVEGVDEQSHCDAVRAAGYTLAQGDLFARPMPAEHVEARVAAEQLPRPRSSGDPVARTGCVPPVT